MPDVVVTTTGRAAETYHEEARCTYVRFATHVRLMPRAAALAAGRVPCRLCCEI